MFARVRGRATTAQDNIMIPIRREEPLRRVARSGLMADDARTILVCPLA